MYARIDAFAINRQLDPLVLVLTARIVQERLNFQGRLSLRKIRSFDREAIDEDIRHELGVDSTIDPSVGKPIDALLRQTLVIEPVVHADNQAMQALIRSRNQEVEGRVAALVFTEKLSVQPHLTSVEDARESDPKLAVRRDLKGPLEPGCSLVVPIPCVRVPTARNPHPGLRFGEGDEILRGFAPAFWISDEIPESGKLYLGAQGGSAKKPAVHRVAGIG